MFFSLLLLPNKDPYIHTLKAEQKSPVWQYKTHGYKLI